MNSDNRRNIYLPEGEWIHLFTGERWQGGRWYYGVDVPLEQMPVFVRPEAEIPLLSHDIQCTDEYSTDDVVTLRVTSDFKGLEI